jgi:hypothetical protein
MTKAPVHGFYASDIVLPRASRFDFSNLLAEIREEFRPEGRIEEETIFDLAHRRWQKRRLVKRRYAMAMVTIRGRINQI